MGQFQHNGVNITEWMESDTNNKSILVLTNSPKFSVKGVNIFAGKVRSLTNAEYHFYYDSPYKQIGKQYPNVRGYAPSTKNLTAFAKGTKYIVSDATGQLWLSDSSSTSNISGTKLGSANSIKVLNVGLAGGGAGGGPGCWELFGTKRGGGGGGGGGVIFGLVPLETTPKLKITPNKYFLRVVAGAGGARQTGWDSNGNNGSDSVIYLNGNTEIMRAGGGGGGQRGRGDGSGGAGGYVSNSSPSVKTASSSGGRGGNQSQSGASASIRNVFNTAKYFGVNDISYSGSGGGSGSNWGGGGGAAPGGGTAGNGGSNDGGNGKDSAGGGGGGQTVNGGNIGGSGGNGVVTLSY